MTVDYHIHAVGHGDRKHTKNEIKPFIEKAVELGLMEIGFADHDWHLSDIDMDNYKELRREYSNIKIRVGLEFEYFPDQVEKIRQVIHSNNFDYTIGSVHFLGNWNFDHLDYIKEYENWTTENFYIKYYETLLGCIETGLFNIAGHLDLVKIFNYRIDAQKALKLANPVLDEIKNQEMVMEINTAGLYKPVKEFYPSLDIIKLAVEKNIPLTISSDAHRFEDVGRNNDMIRRILKDLGVKWIAGFNKGIMHELPI
ncbi:MAG: hypothetical protein APF76_05565 [Desulfitibacter sp. BRH_c19]|nr:MAG: hypothetical protein APF76_05565 [Desulfitibacter sp. BRH_c19]